MKKLSIYNKIQKIQSEVKELIRAEENEKLNYSFFNESAVFEILKPLLQKYKMAILISDDPDSNFECQQIGNSYLVKYLKKLEIINISDDDNLITKDFAENRNNQNSFVDEIKTFSFYAIGVNVDPAKAKGAADTYAIKYMLSKLFLMQVQDEGDPDYQISDNNRENTASKENKQAKEFLKKREDWIKKNN
ncbi:ERF family protein [endosymbiont GvMRE of Glomus versiforme]|uniref:ERF family protein n=1 Tax=endosymbiont GvMRE of Glomus versiforme TaxID=2039283 RepID=UPI000ECF7DFB|nr:ERF family protein [endosymbiont GvMRE of Glomus versiforme]RHZ35271.1 Single-stranded DNA-binding protein [endosymbiont GvMRE of Glomus versiforme]